MAFPRCQSTIGYSCTPRPSVRVTRCPRTPPLPPKDYHNLFLILLIPWGYLGISEGYLEDIVRIFCTRETTSLSLDSDDDDYEDDDDDDDDDVNDDDEDDDNDDM